MELISEAQLPTKSGNFTIKVFKNPISLEEHFVLQNSENETVTPMVRIHSECATGDIFGSLRCDCQDQLHQALELIAANKNGAVIYLKNQEGRGIGISNKIKAYHLQEQGLNTYEANEALGLPVDARNYDDATARIKLSEFGFSVERVLRDYMGIPDVKVVPKVKSVNQEIYKQIRHNLDSSMRVYREKHPINVAQVITNLQESDEREKDKKG
jgi:GTP cyclohydrolase II